MTLKEAQRGLVFVLIGPGGAGKNSLMRDVLARITSVTQLATATTRAIRTDEQQGREHLFVQPDEFKRMIDANELLEWQEVTPGKFYGIPRASVEDKLVIGAALIADIDIYGAQKLRNAYPDDTVLIFITVPGNTIDEQLAVLRERMGNEDRNEKESLIQQRLQRARDLELAFADQCDYVIVNDEQEQAANRLFDIMMEKLQARHLVEQNTLAEHATQNPHEETV